jgi:ATP-dependent Clp protease ATP-binding subunit ClpB
MRMDKLTSRFQQALADAQSLAVGRDHNMLEPVHVLTALLAAQPVTDKLAQKRNDQFIASELFVLAALEDKGETGAALKATGANAANLETAIERMRGGEKVDDANAEETRQALEKYCIDLTARAEHPASSIRSSAVTRKSAAPCRCCSGAPRTTPC